MASGVEHYVAEAILQELRLPEIEGEACVHALLEQASCRSCVQACPRQAWLLDEDSLGLDTEACDGCGLCVPVCPTGALHIHLPWVIRSLGGNLIALFACERSPVDSGTAGIPCIHALGMRQLLLLYASGIRYLMCSCGTCDTCERNGGSRIQDRLEQINRLLADRRQPGIKMLERSPEVWKKIYQTDEMLTRGTRLGRRDFLGGGIERLREQLLVLDPFNQPEWRTLPPGELLPDTVEGETSWPWLPNLDTHNCNGCDACMRLCPTQALQIRMETEKEDACYEVDAARCNGCGICASVCETGAIRVATGLAPRLSRIGLSTMTCRSCGNAFHLPEGHPWLGEELCRICRKKDHTKTLFQVLEE